MGLNLGPPPYNPFHDGAYIHATAGKPDTLDDPHIARCTGCGRRFTVLEYNYCIQDGGTTLCAISTCRGEVLFL